MSNSLEPAKSTGAIRKVKYKPGRTKSKEESDNREPEKSTSSTQNINVQTPIQKENRKTSYDENNIPKTCVQNQSTYRGKKNRSYIDNDLKHKKYSESQGYCDQSSFELRNKYGFASNNKSMETFNALYIKPNKQKSKFWDSNENRLLSVTDDSHNSKSRNHFPGTVKCKNQKPTFCNQIKKPESNGEPSRQNYKGKTNCRSEQKDTLRDNYFKYNKSCGNQNFPSKSSSRILETYDMTNGLNASYINSKGTPKPDGNINVTDIKNISQAMKPDKYTAEKCNLIYSDKSNVCLQSPTKENKNSDAPKNVRLPEYEHYFKDLGREKHKQVSTKSSGSLCANPKAAAALDSLCNETKSELSNGMKPAVVEIVESFSRLSFETFYNKGGKELVCSNTFLSKLTVFLSWLPCNDFSDQNDILEFIGNLLKVLQSVLSTLPAEIIVKFEPILLNAEDVCGRLDKNNEKGLKEKINILCKLFKTITGTSNVDKGSELENLVDYKLRQVFPQNLCDLSKWSDSKSIVGRSEIRNYQEYVNFVFTCLHFKLLQQFRDSIKAYNQNQIHTNETVIYDSVNSVMFFKNVRFLGLRLVEDKICIVTSVKTATTTEMNVNEGSLLLLTKNNFECFTHGIVINDIGIIDITKGHLVIELLDKTCIGPDDLESRFTIAMSDIPHSPCLQVLKGLQRTETNIPIDCLFNADSVNNFANSIVKFEWYDCFDESQKAAFDVCRRSHLSVIQGIPGTGKTYLITKLAQSLLQESAASCNKGPPVLILTKSISALDLILSQLTQYTDKLIRIAERKSENKYLNNFNLQEKSLKMLQQRGSQVSLIDVEIQRLSYAVTLMKQLCLELEILINEEGIISLASFINFNIIKKDHITPFIGMRNLPSEDEFYKWLMLKSRSSLTLPNTTRGLTKTFNVSSPSTPCSSESKLFKISPRISFIETSSNIENRCNEIYKDIMCLQNQWVQGQKVSNEFDNLTKLYEKLKKLKPIICNETSLKKQDDPKVVTEIVNSRNIYKLSPSERWMLYRHYKRQLQTLLWKTLYLVTADCLKFSESYRTYKYSAEVKLTCQSKVLGMTINKAVEHQNLINDLKPKFVIVEEADKIPESSLLVAIGGNCEQLILTGCQSKHESVLLDETTLYNRVLARDTVKPCVLSVQHRLPKKITQILCSTFNLGREDIINDKKLTKVRGTKTCFFFLNHTKLEEEVKVGNELSYKNDHEASFVVSLANFFILKQYSCKDITIITPYSAQVDTIKGMFEHYKQGVKISVITVDEYDGQENSIIIVSLVRGNNNGDIGPLLEDECFVQTLFSHSLIGLYMIGNMDTLTKCSALWKNVNFNLKRNSVIGNVMYLTCKRHSEIKPVCSSECFSVPFKCNCVLSDTCYQS